MAIGFEMTERGKRKDGKADRLSEDHDGHTTDEGSEAVRNADEQTPLLRDET